MSQPPHAARKATNQKQAPPSMDAAADPAELMSGGPMSGGPMSGGPMSGANFPERILRAIRRILRRTSEHSRWLARETGLTVPQAICLQAIGKETADCKITLVDVSRTVQLAPATVSRILDRLESAGLVVRERGTRDRRKVYLTLTPCGIQQLQGLENRPPLQKTFVRKLRRLPLLQQQQLIDSLELIVDLMEATDIDAAPLLESALDPQPETD